MVELSPTVIFFIIVLSVPLQFYLSPHSTSDANYYLHGIVKNLKRVFYYIIEVNKAELGDDVDFEDITEQIDEIIQGKKLPASGGDPADPTTNSYFGGSQEPRDPRPPHVKYRVGQVIRHKVHNYRAVIIAWDEKANAPDWWLRRVHRDRKDWKELPNYTVAIDTRNRLHPQIAYVVEENIVPAQGAVVHPLVRHYFERMDENGKRYKLRPWHEKLYPNG